MQYEEIVFYILDPISQGLRRIRENEKKKKKKKRQRRPVGGWVIMFRG